MTVMLIRVEHSTAYAYSEPLVCQHAIFAHDAAVWQDPSRRELEGLSPRRRHPQWYDQYGNCCHTLTVAQPVTELAIKVSGLVRTRDTNGVVGLAPAELPLGLYLRDTPYTVATEPIHDFAARFAQTQPRRIETVHEIMLAIADDVEYTKGETHVHTTGAEALEQGSGVCQDHAHVFCAVCRTLGIPARYVSGYLSHGAGHEAHASSHAWADAYVEDLGWVSFDPSNRTGATEAYIRTAVGLDYAEAGPVRGVSSGGGVETMSCSLCSPANIQQNLNRGSA